jgi:ribosomal protein L36
MELQSSKKESLQGRIRPYCQRLVILRRRGRVMVYVASSDPATTLGRLLRIFAIIYGLVLLGFKAATSSSLAPACQASRISFWVLLRFKSRVRLPCFTIFVDSKQISNNHCFMESGLPEKFGVVMIIERHPV